MIVKFYTHIPGLGHSIDTAIHNTSAMKRPHAVEFIKQACSGAHLSVAYSTLQELTTQELAYIDLELEAELYGKKVT